MSERDEHHHHAGPPAPGRADDQKPTREPQLEPERLYLLEYQIGAGAWSTLATIDVSVVREDWIVDRKAALNLQSGVTGLRLSLVPKLPAVSNALPETAATAVTWSPATDPRYPATGFTFEGNYVHARGKGILAINLQIQEVTGGAAISSSFWYNPDPSASPVALELSGGVVSMQVMTGAYRGACFAATSTTSFTP